MLSCGHKKLYCVLYNKKRPSLFGKAVRIQTVYDSQEVLPDVRSLPADASRRTRSFASDSHRLMIKSTCVTQVSHRICCIFTFCILYRNISANARCKFKNFFGSGLDKQKQTRYSKPHSLHCITPSRGARSTVQTEQAMTGRSWGRAAFGSRCLHICGTVVCSTDVFLYTSVERSTEMRCS